MMKRNKLRMSPRRIKICINAAVYISMALTVLMSCNGSGGGSDLFAGGGIGGTGISIGTISGFGSVIVNDVDFNTEKAEILVNGNLIGVGDSNVRRALAIGMVVRVEGQFVANDTGRADRIEFSANVKGPVTAIEAMGAAIKKLTVLGQIIIVDDTTNFKGTDFDNLTTGNILQISGWTDGYGFIQASYVALITPPDEGVMARGIITKVNFPQNSLHINQLSIDFSQADLTGFPDDGRPAVGQLVVASGILDPGGVLDADEVRLANDLGVEDADDVEIEGIVSQFSSPSDFVLGTTPVQTDTATVFKGIAPDDLVTGARLLVKGALIQGRLLADEVVAKDKVNLEGTVSSVDYGNAEISLLGFNNLSIHINNFTKIFGNAAELTDIRIDQHVKILGLVAGANKVEAAHVKVEDKDSDKIRLQGPVTLIDRPVITVFSNEVNTDAIPEDGFLTTEDGPVSRNKFFQLVFSGDTVGVNGNLFGGQVEWGEIELLQE